MLSYATNKDNLCVWCAALLKFVFQRPEERFVEDSNCGDSWPTFRKRGKSV